MALLHHMSVLKALNDYSISYVCRQDRGWLLDTISVSSRPLMGILHHKCVVVALDGCSISYQSPQSP